MATRGDHPSFALLADDDEEEVQHMNGNSDTKRNRKKKPRKKKPRKKTPKAESTTILNPVDAAIAEVVAMGFPEADARAAVDEMWNSSAKYDDADAIAAFLTKKRAAKSGAKSQGKGKGKGTSQSKAAAPAPAKAVAAAPVAAAAPAPAPAAAAPAPAPAARSDPADVAERLRTVAAHPDLKKVLQGLTAWVKSSSSEDIDVFFGCGAFDSVIENILSQAGGLSHTESALRKLLLAIFRGPAAQSVVSELISSVRRAQETFVGLQVAAGEDYASVRDEAVGAFASLVVAALDRFRNSTGNASEVAAALSEHERSRVAAATQLARIPASSGNIAAKFQRRDCSYNVAAAELAKCQAIGNMSVGSSRTDGGVDSELVTKLSALSPPESAEAAARQTAVKQRLDALRTQYEDALKPIAAGESELDKTVSTLRARRDALLKELHGIDAELKSAGAKREALSGQRDTIARGFHDEVAALNSEQQGLLTGVNRSEAAGALQKTVSDLSSQLQRLSREAVLTQKSAASSGLQRTRAHFLTAVSSFLTCQEPCVAFITTRVQQARAAVGDLQGELIGYQAMKMATLVDSISAKLSDKKQEVAEDTGLLQHFTNKTSEMAHAVTELVKAGTAAGGVELSPGEWKSVTAILHYLNTRPELLAAREQLAAVVRGDSRPRANGAAAPSPAKAGRRWSTQVNVDDIDMATRLSLAAAKAAEAAPAAPAAAAATAAAPVAAARAPPAARKPAAKKPAKSWGGWGAKPAEVVSLTEIVEETKRAKNGVEESKNSPDSDEESDE